MSNNRDLSIETSSVKASVKVGHMTGMVKWFNSKSGFGFITVCSESEHKGSDIFVHYSAIRSANTQYKYLIQGEYVDFDLVSTETGEHKFNAADVTGVNGGAIMCETRRLAFEQSSHSQVQAQSQSQSQDRRYVVRQPRTNDYAPIQRGSIQRGPRQSRPESGAKTPRSSQTDGSSDREPLTRQSSDR